jgi:hypothetical protein
MNGQNWCKSQMRQIFRDEENRLKKIAKHHPAQMHIHLPVPTYIHLQPFIWKNGTSAQMSS